MGVYMKVIVIDSNLKGDALPRQSHGVLSNTELEKRGKSKWCERKEGIVRTRTIPL